jgi:hypothetical protein
MNQLPPEITLSIISNLRNDRSVLYAPCLACQETLLESRRFLYRNIAIASLSYSFWVPYYCFALESDRGIQLLTRLSETNTSPTEHIHTFCFELNHHQIYSKSDFEPLLHSTLRFIVNLKELSILSYSSPAPIVGADSTIRQDYTFQLHSFRWVTVVGHSR